MKKKRFLCVLVVLFMVALICPLAFASPTLDQSQTSWNYQARAYYLQSECQTFTAGLAGSLVKMSLNLTSNASYDALAPATISIIGTTGEDNHPDDSTVLWTQYYPDGMATGWFDVDTSTGAPELTSGSVYGIKFESADVSSALPNDAWNYNRNSDLYSGGQLWSNGSGVWTTQLLSGYPVTTPDAAFKTYVVAVPVPSAVVLGGLGLVLVSAMRIRRRFSP
jgi:hypothetical protein